MLIRPATSADVKDILEVYAPYIKNTVITFETEVPSIEEFTARIEKIKSKYPYLVCEMDGKVIGYAYAAKYRERAAYKYSVEISIYVDMNHQHEGIGRALYTNLFEALKSYDCYTAYACITLPNEKSIGLHKAFGFYEIGTCHNVGYKMGRWIDVIWLEKPLKQYDTPTATLMP
ncbi:MAG: N-acetyltransferase [Lachnospiraceae bacterium]|nr:N-acetyltransferase [Lachnospiraceae bacterium]